MSAVLAVVMRGHRSFRGIAPHSYFWSTTETTDSIGSLTAGVYYVTVTDQVLCQTVDSVIITEPDSLYVESDISDILCFGLLDGAVNISVFGGTYPFLYIWSNGDSTEDLFFLTTGLYHLTISDVNGCTHLDSFFVNEPEMIYTTFDLDAISCTGNSDAGIDLTVTGGVTPYIYEWSNGTVVEDLNGIEAGFYWVTVTDNNGCIGEEMMQIVVSEPDSILLSLSSLLYTNGFNVSLFDAEDGEISSSVTGGISPYYYLWSTGATTSSISDVGPGLYSLTLTDSNGCLAIESIRLSGPLALTLPTVVTSNSDGLNDFYVILGLESYPNNELQIFNRWGNVVYQETNYQNTWSGKNSSGEQLPEGTYFAILHIDGLDAMSNFLEIKY
jgi:gliding motility-associated-like protein